MQLSGAGYAHLVVESQRVASVFDQNGGMASGAAMLQVSVYAHVTVQLQPGYGIYGDGSMYNTFGGFMIASSS